MINNEKPKLNDDGEYTFTIGWVRETDDHRGLSVRFDTNDSVFFKTFYIADPDDEEKANRDRVLLGKIILAARIRMPTEPRHLLGRSFQGKVSINIDGYINFDEVWRC